MPRVAIIDCDAASPDEDFNGRNVARWLLDPGDGDAGWSFTHVRPKVPGELPRSVDAFDGYVIPGSRSMVTEREGWMEEVEALIRAANAKGKPLVGMCFGHQIIGRALGGTVAPVAVNGEKMNNAVDEIVLTAEAAPYGLSGETSASGSLRLMKGHEQQLVELPPDSTLLGSSTSTAIEVWSNASGNVLCCQGHPDFSSELATKALIPMLEKDGVISEEKARLLSEQMSRDAPHPVDNDVFKRAFKQLLSSGSAAATPRYQPPRRVNQTAFGRKGDALQACFASLLDLPLERVPNFILEPDYLATIQAFLQPLGLVFVKVSSPQPRVAAVAAAAASCDLCLAVLGEESGRVHSTNIIEVNQKWITKTIIIRVVKHTRAQLAESGSTCCR